MKHSQIIDEHMLDDFSNKIKARQIIPDLIFRLIAESINNPEKFKVARNESAEKHGWDVTLDSSIGFEPYFPKGQSFWEIGTSKDGVDKATRDFKTCFIFAPFLDKASCFLSTCPTL